MVRLPFRIIFTTPALLGGESHEAGRAYIAGSSIKGLFRANLEMLKDIVPIDTEILFGNINQSGLLFFKDFIYEGIPEERISVSIDPDALYLVDFIQERNSIPAGASVLSELVILDKVSDDLLVLIKSSLSLIEFIGVGGGRTRGYGRCRVEFVDLQNIGYVFISYAWEELEHNDWVLYLANRLSRDGINVIFDKYDLGIGDNIQIYMENAVEKAKKVIIILTPRYKEKADKRSGGVGYEYSLINTELFNILASNGKVLPVLRKGDVDNSVPKILRQYYICDMRKDEAFEPQYTNLYSAIIGKRQVERPNSKIG